MKRVFLAAALLVGASGVSAHGKPTREQIAICIRAVENVAEAVAELTRANPPPPGTWDVMDIAVLSGMLYHFANGLDLPHDCQHEELHR